MHAVIIDYGMGNLFSVQQACRTAGIQATISADRHDLDGAEAIIVPGVGAYGDAMATLQRLDLVSPLRDAVAAGVPFLGICLGMQLMMTGSDEFGWHPGLGLIEGAVRKLPSSAGAKVPQVGWNRVQRPRHVSWAGTPFDQTADDAQMYFVHSFCVEPADSSVVIATTTYGPTTFCSSLMRGNVFGCQFHPERSGRAGLAMYGAIAAWCARQPRTRELRNV